MNKSNIAIITDSSCDLPAEYVSQNAVYVLPLRVNMPEGSFFDGVDIAPEDIYARMPEVIPTTSQPAPEDVRRLFAKVGADGYKEAIAVCISSGLSGTHDVVSMCAKEESSLKVHVFDSRRLSMALGMLVMQAVEFCEQGSTAEGAPVRCMLYSLVRVQTWQSLANSRYVVLEPKPRGEV